MKTHLTQGCNRGKRLTTDVYQVDCEACKRTVPFQVAKEAADAAKQAAFLEQTPRHFREPWYQEDKLIACRFCGGILFRQADRTCYGHYANYVCANCGNTESRLTETGMSF
jgi:hypothetical protein